MQFSRFFAGAAVATHTLYVVGTSQTLAGAHLTQQNVVNAVFSIFCRCSSSHTHILGRGLVTSSGRCSIGQAMCCDCASEISGAAVATPSV
jgi:hypothetical protein